MMITSGWFRVSSVILQASSCTLCRARAYCKTETNATHPQAQSVTHKMRLRHSRKPVTMERWNHIITAGRTYRSKRRPRTTNIQQSDLDKDCSQTWRYTCGSKPHAPVANASECLDNKKHKKRSPQTKE